MRNTGKKLISLLLALSMLLSLCVIPAAATEPTYAATVYVSTEGSDDNDGSSAEKAVATMDKAYELLNTAMAGAAEDAVAKLVVSGTFAYGGTTKFTSASHDYTVLMTGATQTDGMSFKGNINIPGPTIFENITISRTGTSAGYFNACGYPMVIGEGVLTPPNESGAYLSLVGAQRLSSTSSPYTGNTNITVKSGTWLNVFAGNGNNDITGDAVFTMTGGTVTGYICGNVGSKKVHKGDLTINISGGTVCDVYGGAYNTASAHQGNTTITISNAVVNGSVYGGGQKETAATTGNVSVSVSDSTVTGNITPVCDGTATVNLGASAGKTLSLNGVGELAVNSFTGGGDLVLGSGAKLTLGSVTGKTALTVNGLAADTVYITAAGSDTAAFTDAVTTDTYDLTGTVNGSNVEWKFTEQASGGDSGEGGGNEGGADGEQTPSTTIYVDAVNGDNDNDGLTEATAVATLRGAYLKLAAAAEAAGVTNDANAVMNIVVSGMDTTGFAKSSVTSTGFTGNHVYTVHISGKTAADGVTFTGNLNIPGPTVFENITLVNNATAQRYLSANGFALTIGEGVTCTAIGSSGTYFNIVGGKHNATAGGTPHTGNTSITVKSGIWQNIYFGNSNNNLTGNAALVMTGGEVLGDIKTMSGNGTFDGDESVKISDCTIGGTITLASLDGHTTTVELGASSGKTLSLTGVSELAVGSFTGGGTLALGRSAALTMDSVSGSTALKVTSPVAEQKYVTVKNSTNTTAFTDADTTDVYELKSAASGSDMVWTFAGGGETPVVKLTAPSDVTLVVYDGFGDDAVVVTPNKTTTENGITTYVFSALTAGSYRYEVSGDGYYTVKKLLNITEDDITNGKVINADPGKKAGNGYEPSSVTIRTDEVLEKLFPSSKTQWGAEYESIFVTPAFDGTDAAHEYTSHAELMAFINGLDDANDNMYVYNMGKSPKYQLDTPLIVFTKTDISGKTLEEAAAILKDQAKPMVQYTALVHGCEPSASEGALTVVNALDGAYGENLLDEVNIYVMPRVNVDGAVENYANDLASGAETNRDYMQLDALSVEYVHRAYNLFMPDVAVDGHEFAPTNMKSEGSHALQDVCVGGAGNENAPAALNDLAWQLQTDTMLNAFKDVGLRAVNYTNTYLTDPGPHRGRGHFNLLGSISILFEVQGQTIGRIGYERRVLTHYVGVTYVFDYVAEHAAEIQSTVDAARQELIAKGATYEADTTEDRVVLEHKLSTSTSPKKVQVAIPTFSYVTGESVDANKTKYVYAHETERVRTRPTAYVISKSESWAAEAMERFTKSGVSYYELEPNAAVKLQQYSGTESAVTLKAEEVVIFADGAYVIPMNQVAANVIALRMEPDVTDSSGFKGSLLQTGYFAADGGAMPIYRYIHDLVDGKIALETVPAAPTGLSVVQPASLGADGKIIGLDANKLYEYKGVGEDDYKAVPAGSAEITGLAIGVYSVRYAATATAYASYPATLEVIDGNISEYVIYVGGSNASDSNNGLTEAKAVATLNAAYEKLAKIMANAPAGTDGKIVFLGEVVVEKNGSDSTNNWNNLPAHDYKVVLVGKTGSAGITSGVIIIFNGDTELTNLTLTSTASGTPFLSASGNDLVIGEGITSVANGTTYYGIVGGGKAGSGVVADSTNVVVKSGIWKEIHAGGYTPAVKGNVKLTMNGGTVTGNIYAAFNGNIGGDVTMNLSGVTVDGTIYGGHMYTASGSSDKSVDGNVTIFLGEGAKVNKVYGGGLYRSNVKGTANIIVDGAAQVGALNGGSEVSGTVTNSVITLKSGMLSTGFTASADKIVIDLTGSKALALPDSLTVNELTGGGTISLPAGKVLTVTDSVTGTATVALTGTITAGTAVAVAPSSAADSTFTSVTELTAAVDGTTKVWSVVAAHEHSYTNKNSGTLASAATCQAGEKYYVQCDSCDAVSDSETVTVGNPVDHSYSKAWKTDATKHWHECTYGCGTKTDEAAHVPGAAATETTAQTCTVCGYEIAPATGPVVPDGVPSSFAGALTAYDYSSSDSYTVGYRVGAKDGKIYICVQNANDFDINGTHFSIVIADSNNQIVVQRKDYASTRAALTAGKKENSWATNYVYSNLADGEYTVYAWCYNSAAPATTYGTTFTFTVGTPAHTHSYTTKASSQLASAATCTAAAKYYVQCDGCEEVSTEKTVSVGEPAGHSYTTKASGTLASAATCTAAAKYYVQCDGCEEVSTEKTVSVGEPAAHTPGTEWKKDANKHWHECTANCGTKLDEAAHTPGAAATATTAQTCTICGYVIAPATGGSGSGGSGGGSSSGGGGGSSPTTSTTTQKNPDGSTTTTTTNKVTGTVTETTKTDNGTTATTVTDKSGNVTEVSATVPAAAAKDAAEKGDAVTLPVKVESTSDSKNAVEIKVSVPTSGAAVEIPVENVTSGTVVVVVKADGSEEIVKTSTVNENGVVVTLEESATIKVIDNSKAFSDVHVANHWAEESIDFVVSRGLFNGKTTETFAPNDTTTRGQLMTVLARLSGADTTGTPIQKGMEWAVKNGISDGSNANGNITRQQLAVMLWRYAGEPESDHSVEHHTDDHMISAYAETAMAWAIEYGILTGYADGSLKPHANATRAHVATMMARFVKYLA